MPRSTTWRAARLRRGFCSASERIGEGAVAVPRADELERIYQIGRRDAEATLPALETYLAG